MNKIEKRGKILLIGVVSSLIIFQFISMFIDFGLPAFFEMLLLIAILGFLYNGYTCARVITAIISIISLITKIYGLIYLVDDLSPRWFSTYLLIAIGLHILTLPILLFSKGVSEYMYLKRYG